MAYKFALCRRGYCRSVAEARQVYAQREVRGLVPHGFESSVEILVNRKKDLICRADFRSRTKQESNNGAYLFKDDDSGEASSGHVWFRSDHLTVVIDNWSTGPLISR